MNTDYPRLTAEIARSWPHVDAEAFSGIEDEAAQILAAREDDLELARLLHLSDSAAEILARSRCEMIDLDGLTQLSDAAALALAQYPGALWIDGVESFSSRGVEALLARAGDLSLGISALPPSSLPLVAQHRGTLHLRRLARVSEPEAEALAQHPGLVRLSGLTSLTHRALAAKLAEDRFGLDLFELVSVSYEAADALAAAESYRMELPELKLNPHYGLAHRLAFQPGGTGLLVLSELTVADAERLGASREALDLDSLTELSDAAAERLGRHRGTLMLNGLTTLSARAAAGLGTHRGYLSFLKLGRISAEVAEGLASSRGELMLLGLTELTDAAAAALAKHVGVLDLRSVPVLSDEAAAALARHAGPIVFHRELQVQERGAEALFRYTGGAARKRGAFASPGSGHTPPAGASLLSDAEFVELVEGLIDALALPEYIWMARSVGAHDPLEDEYRPWIGGTFSGVYRVGSIAREDQNRELMCRCVQSLEGQYARLRLKSGRRCLLRIHRVDTWTQPNEEFTFGGEFALTVDLEEESEQHA